MCELCESDADLLIVAGEALRHGHRVDDLRESTDEAPRQFDRRSLIRRGLIASGVAGITVPLISEALSAAAAPRYPFETVGLGNDGPLSAAELTPAGGRLLRAARASRSIRSAAAAGNPTIHAAVATGSSLFTIAPDAAGVPWASHVAPLNLTGPPPPPIVTRAEWGADESIRTHVGAFSPIRKLVVHHTASAPSNSDPASGVRLIYDYHVQGRGYDDIGYNFVIDHKGTVYEGRWARNYAAGELHTGEAADGWGVVGGHTKGMNSGACGVVLIGDFTRVRPTNAALHSLVALLAWKAGRHQIDVLANDVYVPLYGGLVRRTPNLAGHRDIGVTACPGNVMYPLLPAIRQHVAQLAGTWPPLTVNNPKITRFFGSRTNPPADTGDPQTLAGGPPSGLGGGSARVLGYRVASADGVVRSVGVTTVHSPAGGPVVAIAGSPAGGYALLNPNGTTTALAGAASAGGIPHNRPAVAVDMAYTATGKGYWILTADGGVYHLGAARDGGSPKRQGIGNGRKIAASSGGGYWILTNDGTIRAYGNAPALGSPPRANPAIDLAPTPSGRGYWALLSNGAVAAFGEATAYGGLSGAAARSPIAIAATPSGKGYVIVSGDGLLNVFGDAPNKGSLTGLHPVGVTVVYA
jgi:N-acetylmuramoyl-L-alanine amidase